MSILLTLLFLLLVVIWLLSVPIHVKLIVDTDSVKKVQVRIQWMYGFLNFQIHDSDQLTKIKPKLKKTKKRLKRKPKAGKGNGRFILTMLNSEGFLKRIIQFFVDCIKAIKFLDTQVKMKIGLGDPADTGQTLAILAPLFVWLRLSLVPNARLEADYYEPTFYLFLSSNIRFVPLDYVRLLVSLTMSPIIWRGVIHAATKKSQ